MREEHFRVIRSESLLHYGLNDKKPALLRFEEKGEETARKRICSRKELEDSKTKNKIKNQNI